MASYVVTKLDKAKTQVVIDHPFFANILLKRDLIRRDDVKTLAVDRRGNIYYNEEFVESLSVPQIVFALCHEVMHVVGQHVNRLGDRKMKKWNIATDAWINDTLQEANVGQFIEGAVNMPGSKDETSEDIYAKLPDDPDGGDGRGEGPGTGDNGFGSEFMPDEGGTPSPDEIKAIEASNKVDIAQAAQAAKMRGKLPANIARIVEDIIFVKTPWYDVLERYMTSVRNTDNSWKRPNRRFKPHGHYLPVRKSEGSMGEMALVIDTSGSIGQKELQYFSGHLNRIIELCMPEKLHVIYCDSRVAHVDVFDNTQYPVKLEGHGGGGTDMCEAINYINEQGIDPAVCVVLTDGWTPFPSSESFPTIWAMTTEVVAPSEAGTTLPIDMGD